MARQVSSQLTEVELQILRILWDDGPSIARHIHDRLPVTHLRSNSIPAAVANWIRSRTSDCHSRRKANR